MRIRSVTFVIASATTAIGLVLVFIVGRLRPFAAWPSNRMNEPRCSAHEAKSTAAASMKEATQQRILFISYEFSGPLFSGNGVYSRTVVRALLQTLPNAEVLALCGSPPRSSVASVGVASASSSPLFDAPAALSSRLKVEQLQLRRWGSIDRSAVVLVRCSATPKRMRRTLTSRDRHPGPMGRSTRAAA